MWWGSASWVGKCFRDGRGLHALKVTGSQPVREEVLGSHQGRGTPMLGSALPGLGSPGLPHPLPVADEETEALREEPLAQGHTAARGWTTPVPTAS